VDSTLGPVITGAATRIDLQQHLWVSYEIHVPRDYSLEISTQAGNIQTGDINGRVSLVTNAGNITAGSIGGGTRVPGTPAARLESTVGGHIVVHDVNGDLRAVTAAGHITAGNVTGDAVLITGGGHIRAGVIGGTAELQTGGGNISVQHVGAHVHAQSKGGQISFGEAAGAIQAHTAGGGIRILQVAGPMQLDSNGGSIFLTKVDGPVHASTGEGSITAWLSPSLKVAAPSRLESAQGDIVIYMPRRIHLTVLATIDGQGHRILADPSIPIKFSYSGGDTGKRVQRGECSVNGGGEVLNLRANEGNIQLRYVDAAYSHMQQLVQAQIMQELYLQKSMIDSIVQQGIDTKDQMNLDMRRMAQEEAALDPAAQAEGDALNGSTIPPQSPLPPFAPRPAAAPLATPPDGAQILWQRLDKFWWGGVKLDPAEEQKRLIHQVRPVYPDVAQQAGISGTVSMQVLIGKDGAVQNVRVLSGESVLQHAAVNAVKQWRYQPYLLDGEPMPVITTVNLEFVLQ
jgi:TonB family protein